MAVDVDAPSAEVNADDSVDVVAEDAIDDADRDESDDKAESRGESEESGDPSPRNRSTVSPTRAALVFILAVIVGLSCLAAVFINRTLEARSADQVKSHFLSAGRQAALNLTTIDYRNLDADIQRVLDGSTGQFFDEFQRNSTSFAQMVSAAQATSTGTITEAGVESVDGNTAQVLVLVTVNTANAAAPQQDPRYWRMRITVQDGPDGPKVSNVGFVP